MAFTLLHTDPIRTLADAVRAALEPNCQPIRIDAELARLAIRRHRVGPLLHAAAVRNALGISEDLKNHLVDHANANARRAALGQLFQARIVRALATAGIPCLVIKGLPLASQLYPDPSWRHFGDIDLLVRPRDFRGASACLTAQQIAVGNGELSGHGPFAALSGQLLRDTLLHDAVTGLHVEVHQRLFFTEPGGTSATWHKAFAPRLTQAKDAVPTPSIGASLAFYLLLHGALSAWRRMKWLVDILLLMPHLSATDATELVAIAETSGTALSVKASLVLLRSVFACSLPQALEIWIESPSGANRVARRLAFYSTRLNEPREAVAHPAHSRSEALKSLLLLLEPAPQRLDAVLRGSMASGLRVAMRHMHALTSGTR